MIDPVFHHLDLPRRCPTVRDAQYTVGGRVISLSRETVQYGPEWQERDVLDLTSKGADLLWMKQSLNIKGPPRRMRQMLLKLPFIRELQAARNDGRGKTRRQRDLAPPILDIKVRGRDVQVSKNKRKVEVYINNIQDLQFIMDNVWADLSVVEDHIKRPRWIPVARRTVDQEDILRQPAQPGLAEDNDAEHDDQEDQEPAQPSQPGPEDNMAARDAHAADLNQRFGIDCLLSRINAHRACDSVVLAKNRLRIKRSGRAWAWVPIPGAAKKQRQGDVQGYGQTVMDAAMHFLDGNAEEADNDQDEVIQAVVEG